MENVPLYRVAITYNVKKGTKSGAVVDDEAEYDSVHTIEAIKDVLESKGQKVILLDASADIIDKIKLEKFDIAFNIAEGVRGRARESFIPALLTAMDIPFTGSDEATLAITLDKALCKKIISYHKIKTPGFCVLYSENDKVDSSLNFPLIVKPNAEGSGKGIIDTSVANNEDELYFLINRIQSLYRQAALVEEFIRGREFTVSIMGNGDETEVLPPMEIVYNRDLKYNIYSYNIKQNYKRYVKYECPANLTAVREAEIKAAAKEIYRVLECRDLSRIDFRMDEKTGASYFIEINPLPGLAPSYSDFPMIAEFIGITYGELIIKILNIALKRYGMAEIK